MEIAAVTLGSQRVTLAAARIRFAMLWGERIPRNYVGHFI